MKILNIRQGSPEWHEARANAEFTSSMAPIVMGASTHTSRDELLRMMATGDEQEFSDWFQRNVLDHGHEVEAATRPMIEEQVGGDLYPVTCVTENEQLTERHQARRGQYLTSLDGLTLTGSTAWECKQWNQDKAADVSEDRIPVCDYWQCVHHVMVSQAEKIIYTLSDGQDRVESVEREIPESDIDRLLDAYAVFREDLASWRPPETVQEWEGQAPDTLPALRFQVRGEVLDSNVDQFEGRARAIIRSINTELETDEDFAHAEQATRWCKDVERRLEEAKRSALEQTASLDDLFSVLDSVREEARTRRLTLEKQVKRRKEEIRAEIVQAAEAEIYNYVAEIEERLGIRAVIRPHYDIRAELRGKKRIASLYNAANDEVARAKAEAVEIAYQVETNLDRLEELAPDRKHMFPDLNQLLTKDTVDFEALVKTRCMEHEQKLAEEARRQAERQAEQEAVKSEPPAKYEVARQADQTSDIKASRPSDEDIIAALALHYRVHEYKVIEWLMSMDLEHQARTLEEAI